LVKSFVKINGYVACTPDFVDQPKVFTGASDLMTRVFGENGRHARSAIGQNVLPLDTPVEVEGIFEV
ncbi:MAG: RidA family protein, partial [Christensenellaceae bacterium]|nr:RidA family protein [Christensenellaceae bacterium]